MPQMMPMYWILILLIVICLLIMVISLIYFTKTFHMEESSVSLRYKKWVWKW